MYIQKHFCSILYETYSMMSVDLVTHMNYNNISFNIIKTTDNIGMLQGHKLCHITVRFLSDIEERSYDILLVYLHNEKIIAEFNVTGLNKLGF